MEMLIAAVAAQRLHVGHPEVVGEGTDPAYCLLEGVLDLEAQAVETNDIDGVKRSVCTHEEAGTSRGMDHALTKRTQPAGGTATAGSRTRYAGWITLFSSRRRGLGLVGSRWRLAEAHTVWS